MKTPWLKRLSYVHRVRPLIVPLATLSTVLAIGCTSEATKSNEAEVSTPANDERRDAAADAPSDRKSADTSAPFSPEGACSDPATTVGGDLAIMVDADLARATTIRCVKGNLGLNLLGATQVDLPRLEWVGGTLTLGGTGTLTSLRLDRLRGVGGDADFGSLSYPTTSLRTMSLPLLERVGGRLQFSANDSLGELALPFLESTSYLLVEGNMELEHLRLPRLIRVDRLSIRRNTKLARCHTDAILTRLVANGVSSEVLEVDDTDPDATCSPN